MCDFIFILSNELKWFIYSRALTREYKHFNELGKANIKPTQSHLFYLFIQFDLFYEGFETAPYMTWIEFFFRLNDNACNVVLYAVFVI